MNLQDDKQENIQKQLDFSVAPTGEAREVGREETESSGATSESENPARTRLEPPCTDPYARWCGRGRRATAAPMPIQDMSGANASPTRSASAIARSLKRGRSHQEM